MFLMLSFFLLCCHEPTKEETNIFKCYIGKIGLSKIIEDNNSYEIVVSTILVNNSHDTIHISWEEDSLSLNYPSTYLHSNIRGESDDCLSFVPLAYSPVIGVIGEDTLSFHARLWKRELAPQDTIPMVLVFHRYQTKKSSETLLHELDGIQLLFDQKKQDNIKDISFMRNAESRLYYGENSSYGFNIYKKKKGKPYDY